METSIKVLEWHFHEISLEAWFIWYFHSILVLPWCFHDALMVLPWEFPLCSHGASMGLPCVHW